MKDYREREGMRMGVRTIFNRVSTKKEPWA